MSETFLVEVQVDPGSSQSKVDSLTKSIFGLNTESEKLEATNKDLEAQGKKSSTQFDENSKKISENKNEVVKQSAERKTLAKAIDINGNSLKDNSAAADKNKLSIQSASVAVDKIIPGFDGLSSSVSGASTFIKAGTNSVTGMGTAMKIMLGPIGLIISALGAFIVWLKSSEAGGDFLAKTIAQLGAIMSVLTDRLAAVGGAIAKVFSGDFTGAWEDMGEAVSGVGDEMSREVKIAGDLADTLDELGNRQLDYKVQVSSTANEIKKLILESKNKLLTEQQKIDKIKEATNLEIKQNEVIKGINLDKVRYQIAEVERKNSQLKLQRRNDESELDYAKRLTSMREIKFDDLEALGEAVIELNTTEGESLNIQEKMNNMLDAQAEKQAAKIAKIEEMAQKEFEAYTKSIETTEKMMEANTVLYESVKAKIDEKSAKEEAASIKTKMFAANDSVEKQIQLDNQARANAAASQKVIENQEKENAAKIASIKKAGDEIIGTTTGIVNGIFQAKQNALKLEENAINVKLANEKIAINQAYAAEIAALDDKFKKGEISKEEYDDKIKATNEKNKAEIKAAEIKSALELNEVKRKQFETEKKNRIATAIADGAKAALSTFAYAAGGLILKGIAAAAAVAFAAIQIAQIKKEEFVPTTFAEGGDVKAFNIGGKDHSRGGTTFRGSDGSKFVAQKDEGMFIMKREANKDLISRLSKQNQKFGGRSFFNDGGSYFELGGQFNSTGTSTGLTADQIEAIVISTASALPRPVVYVETIATKQSEVNEVEAKSNVL